jgi:hypothetical protein
LLEAYVGGVTFVFDGMTRSAALFDGRMNVLPFDLVGMAFGTIRIFIDPRRMFACVAQGWAQQDDQQDAKRKQNVTGHKDLQRSLLE